MAASCSKDEPTVEQPASKAIEGQFKIQMYNNGQAVALNDTLRNINGFNVILNTVKFYLSDVTFISNDSSASISQVELINMKSNEGASFPVKMYPGTYTSFKANAGLDADLNNSDPASFPNEDPLSIYNSMYWSMLKYRFAIIEGKAFNADTTFFLAYHPGTDEVLKTIELNTPVEWSATNNMVELSLDVKTLFEGENSTNTVDFYTEADTHSANAKQITTAHKIMTNLVASLKLN